MLYSTSWTVGRIEPLLYRIIYVNDYGIQGTKYLAQCHAFIHTLESKPASFRHHTHHLFLGNGVTDDDAVQILSRCTGTSNLALFIGDLHPEFLPLMTIIPLVRLSTNLGRLFGSARVDFDHPVFAHITHLDIFDSDTSPPHNWPVALGRLPCLTHISFNFPVDWIHTNYHRRFFQDVLAHCSFLKVLVLMGDDGDDLHFLKSHYEYFGEDTRSVLMTMEDYVEDWKIGAEGGADYWVRAEEFIRRRQSGEIQGEFVQQRRRTHTYSTWALHSFRLCNISRN